MKNNQQMNLAHQLLTSLPAPIPGEYSSADFLGVGNIYNDFYLFRFHADICGYGSISIRRIFAERHGWKNTFYADNAAINIWSCMWNWIRYIRKHMFSINKKQTS